MLTGRVGSSSEPAVADQRDAVEADSVSIPCAGSSVDPATAADSATAELDRAADRRCDALAGRAGSSVDPATAADSATAELECVPDPRCGSLEGRAAISIDPATAECVIRGAVTDHGRELRALRRARARRLAIALGLARAEGPE